MSISYIDSRETLDVGRLTDFAGRSSSWDAMRDRLRNSTVKASPRPASGTIRRIGPVGRDRRRSPGDGMTLAAGPCSATDADALRGELFFF